MATYSITAALTGAGSFGGATTYSLFAGTANPGGPAVVGPASYTVGTEFHVTSPASVTALRFYRSSTGMVAPITGRIYSVDPGGATGSPVAGTDVTFALSGVGWHTVVLPTPVALTVGAPYRVAISYTNSDIPSGYHYWDRGAGANGITNGPLTAPNQANSIGGMQGTFIGGAGLQFPNYDDNNNHANNGSDVVVEAPDAFVATPGTGGMAGAGTMGATSTAATTGAGAFAGAGALGAPASVIEFATTTALNAAGSMSATATGAEAAAVALSAAGALSVAGAQDTSTATTNLTASGTLTVMAVLTSGGTGGQLSAAGSLSSSGVDTVPATGDLSAQGSLSSLGQLAEPSLATLNASAQLSAAALLAAVSASILSATGALTATTAPALPAFTLRVLRGLASRWTIKEPQ